MHTPRSRARGYVALLVALLVGAVARPAFAQATLLDGLGGPAGFGTQYVPPDDDGSWCGDGGSCNAAHGMAIDVTGAFPGGFTFFGHTYTQVYVNNNGNITFADALSDYTPMAFPGASQPIIAPWWGDVDTRGDSVTTGNLTWWDLRPGQFVVTWHNVGYYSEHYDKRNDFQLILSEASGCGLGDFDVEFRYHQCQWTTGDASDGGHGFGGEPAVAGFDSGDGIDYVTLPGSASMDVLNLCTTSNVSMPGVWRFRIRGGALPCMGSNDPCVDTMTPGLVGACRDGRVVCRGDASLCIATAQPQPEVCDGQDNDCDGMTDNGTGLCPAGQICDRGACVGACVEDSCFSGQTCTTEGTCVETDCLAVTCPDGQTCRGGACVGPCDGVYCPSPSVCQFGRCVDPCERLHCPMGMVCVDGGCQQSCPCNPCADGQVCVPSTGLCVDRGCETTTCPTGQQCRGGTCVDPCTPLLPDQRVCGDFEHCVAGACVANTTADAGTDAAPSDAGTRDADVAPSDAPSTMLRRPAGCGCRTAVGSRERSPRGGDESALGLALVAGILVARRRRRA